MSGTELSTLRSLPVGSFRESGTGINTTIFRAWKIDTPTSQET